MFYLSNFARTKGAKDKQPRKRNSLAQNLAITSLPTVYSSYLFGNALQVGEKNYLKDKVKRTKLNIKEKIKDGRTRVDKYELLLKKIEKGKELTDNQKLDLKRFEGYNKIPNPDNAKETMLLTGREITGLDKSKKLLPKLEKKYNYVKEIPTPKNLKDALIPKLKYLTPARLGLTVLGGGSATILTGALLKRIREEK